MGHSLLQQVGFVLTSARVSLSNARNKQTEVKQRRLRVRLLELPVGHDGRCILLVQTSISKEHLLLTAEALLTVHSVAQILQNVSFVIPLLN